MLSLRYLAPLVALPILATTFVTSPAQPSPAEAMQAGVVQGPILDTWNKHRSALGSPTSNERCGLKDGGCFQKFQRGSIHHTKKTGAHPTLRGPIQSFWGQSNYENGFLGYPTGAPLTFKYNSAAQYQYFQGAMVTTHSQAGTHALQGAIQTGWKRDGWERSAAGLPTTGERKINGGVYQKFQGGSYHWSSKSGAHFTKNGAAIQKKWGAQGYENGPLGYPTSNERSINGGAYQQFQGGSIHWSSKTGAHITKRGGPIQKAWGAEGYENGKLGYPTSDEYTSGGKTWQDFQGGKISWTSAEGARVHYPNLKPGTFTFTGSGFGHGVGMSQYGAQGMAKEGRSTKQILEHYYNPAKLESTTSYANSLIRVQTLGGVTRTTVTPQDGSLRLRLGSRVVQTASPVLIEQKGSQRVYTYGGQTMTSSSSYDTIEWQGTRNWTGTQKTTVKVAGADGGRGDVSYRHGRIFVNTLSSKLNVVNEVRMNDEYLYGLAEMPSSWEPAALGAQAVAGRTYAMRNMTSLKSDCGCHVYDEVKSQKFTGWNKENEGVNAQWGKRWKSAVDSTLTRNSAGTVSNAQVMRYNGSYIDAVYSSSSAGKTQDSRDMWGGSVDYLKSRNDPWSVQAHNPNRSWTEKKTQAQVASAFGLPDVSTVSVQRNAAGYVTTATAKSVSGKTASLTGAQLRSKFGLRSSAVSAVTG